jgi:superfamily I DNA/RNA helicase
MVVVDEAQDMNACQLEIAQKICKGRLVVVGDDRQAIYAFAGADSGSLDRLKAAYNATELPLNTTYRCGRAIVEEARSFVPDFAAGPDNAEGTVAQLTGDKLVATAGPGDFILSRVNAPLVSVAMSLLRAGKRTKIAGRDIGKGLVTLARKLHASSVPDFLRKIEGWRQRESQRLQSKFKNREDSPAYQQRLDGIADQAGMLSSLADGARNVQEIVDRIEALFTDDGLGDKGLIVCSSVHKAKGREADNVFILRDTLRPGMGIEEDNICYVAVTRAKHTLTYVTRVAE